MGEEIIKVLDHLDNQFGLAIDWTSDNVLPYLSELSNKYIKEYKADIIRQEIGKVENKDKLVLKSKAFINYDSPIDDEICLNIYLIGNSNYSKTDGVDENNKELTFKMIYNDVAFKEEKEIPSFKENDKITLEKIKVKANTKNIYEIITSFYINNLDQNDLVNNNIIFNYNFEKIDC